MEIGEQHGGNTQNQPEIQDEDRDEVVEQEHEDRSSSLEKREPRGWTAMPYILGNETMQRLATFGLLPNLNLYLLREFRMAQASAASLLSIWGGTTGFAPLLGAFIADAYLGRFKTIAVGLLSSFLGLLILTIGAWIPHLHPQKCSHLPHAECSKPTRVQWEVFFTGLSFLTLGTAGVMPCNIPFGIDQFDAKTEKGVKGIASFINWYFASFSLITILGHTGFAYIFYEISWAVGFTTLAACMLCALVIFFTGSRIYVFKRPQGSIYTSVIQVFVAYYKKRRVELPDVGVKGVYYDPPTPLLKVHLSNHFRFLNKAALIQENDLNSDGSCKNPWRLSTVQAVEDVKCLIKVIPILLSGMISLISVELHVFFLTSQAVIMHVKLGNLDIPPTSVSVISNITAVVWILLYDRILVPKLRKYMKNNDGITTLQRMGIGIMFSILSMIVGGIVEKERRLAAQNAHPMTSVFWLAPQLILLGFSEAFCNVGQIEFYNKELPQHMGSVAGALFPVAMAGSKQFSTVVIKLVQLFTKNEHHVDWLNCDLNAGRLDYFYYLLAVVGVVNIVYHVCVARQYCYEVARMSVEENGVELTSTDV